MKTKPPRHRPSRPPSGPFSRPINVRDIPSGGMDVTIEAKPEECPGVARDTRLPGVASLSVRYRLVAHAGGRVEVTGRLEARITQDCVVSLEPFDSDVTQEIDLAFAPSAEEPFVDTKGDRRGRHDDRDQGAAFMPVSVAGNDDQPDPPDPIIDDTIDLGAVALEFLTLSLDPYPRKPGVQFEDVVVGGPAEGKPSPFAALERLKDRS